MNKSGESKIMRFRTGEKVYSKSLDYNLVIGCKEGDYAYTCIDMSQSIYGETRFVTYVVSENDLELGWKNTAKHDSSNR